jgi:nicotinamide-nucleotide amidase
MAGGPRGADAESVTLAADVVGILVARRLTIAVAESLTGGLLVAELVSVPGASAVVRGGVVAYATPLKQSLLGVDAALLAERGAVDPEVARQMAAGVRERLAIDGTAAAIGLATTGVAGPDQQDGHPVGEVWLGLAMDDEVLARRLELGGDRAAIRAAAVTGSLSWLRERLLAASSE